VSDPVALVLALNCGSSSLKFEVGVVTRTARAATLRQRPLRGELSNVGKRAKLALDYLDPTESPDSREPRRVPARDMREAVAVALEQVFALAAELELQVVAVAHRMVHGGARFAAPVRLDAGTCSALRRLALLAPLHQGPALDAVAAARAATARGIPHVAVFDTAFHAALPEVAWRLPIPSALADRAGVRRFGFHGIALEALVPVVAEKLGVGVAGLDAIFLHLGAGCSTTVVRRGRSIGTSMGLTPLGGMMMAKRSGDLDPAACFHLGQRLGLGAAETIAMLERESGLLGVSGRSADFRELEARTPRDRRAALAIDMFVRSVRAHLGAALALLPQPQAIVFSGGIGARGAQLRRRALDGLEPFGLRLDARRNARPACTAGEISPPRGGIRIYALDADEGLVLLRAATAAAK
jgi:acetate kinase